jgi:hypothetical protein
MGSQTILMVYSVISTITIIVLSLLYAYCGPAICESENIENMNGDVNKFTKSETDLSLISFKESSDNLSPEQQDCECGGLAGLQWTILEITVIGLIGIGCLAGSCKGFAHFKNLFLEKREKVKNVRKQKIRDQVETELAEKSAGSHKSADLAPENYPNQLCKAERRESKPEILLTYP